METQSLIILIVVSLLLIGYIVLVLHKAFSSSEDTIEITSEESHPAGPPAVEEVTGRIAHGYSKCCNAETKVPSIGAAKCPKCNKYCKVI